MGKKENKDTGGMGRDQLQRYEEDVQLIIREEENKMVGVSQDEKNRCDVSILVG